MTYIDLKYQSISNPMTDPSGHNLVREWLYVRASDLARDIPKDPNPRAQNTNTSVAKKIRASMEDPYNEHFHIYNRGILIVAKRTERVSDGILRIYLQDEGINDDAKYGIADGATSYAVIVETVPQTSTADQKFVTVEVISNVESTDSTSADLILNQTVNARNTSVQVKDVSLQDHRGKYDFIKAALSGTQYEGKIRYKENGEGVFPVEDVVKMLFLLNPEQEPVARRLCHGPNVYAQTYPLRIFETNHESYQRFQSILPEVLQIFDFIGAKSAKLYNNGYKGKVKAGSSKTFGQKTYLGTPASPFIGLRADRFPVKAVWFACFNALRLLIRRRGNRFMWSVPFEDVQTILESGLHKMIAKSNEIIKEMGKDPDKAARDGYILWESVYQTFERHLKDHHIRGQGLFSESTN